MIVAGGVTADSRGNVYKNVLVYSMERLAAEAGQLLVSLSEAEKVTFLE
jgi:hypothetical protein